MIDRDTQDAFLFSKRTNQRDVSQTGAQGAHHPTSPDEHGPLIGLPVPIQQSSQGLLLLADAAGAWAIERMLARVLLIPLWPFPTHQHVYQSLWPLMQSIDGLLLPAGIQGTDWYAHWSTRQSHPGPQPWVICWEIALAQLATYLGMPLLAIGDGAEKWNVALGGSCREPQPTASTTLETWDRYRIRVRTPSKLASSLQPALATVDGQEEQEMWKLAFQPQRSVENVAAGLRCCAQSDEMAVVAFERRDAVFGLGMLGRLDWGLDQAYATILFDAFLQACCSFAYSRQQNHGWESSREMICATLSDLVTHSQPLIAAPGHPSEKRRGSGHLSASLPSSIPSTGPQGQLRQRSAQPTKEQLNSIRRRRLKVAAR